jgi:hypothetical protein
MDKRALTSAQPAAFVSGIVLLLSIWGGRRMGMVTDSAREMADVHKCMDVMKACETRCVRTHPVLYQKLIARAQVAHRRAHVVRSLRA